MDGLGDVLGANVGGAADIGDGASDFEDAIVGARGETHAADGHLEGPLAGSIEGTLLANEARGHARVVIPAGALDGAGAFDTFADLGRGFAGPTAAQLLVRNGGDFDVDVDTIE